VISKAKLKFFASLKERKVRQDAGLFLVDGEKAFREALKAGLRPEVVFYTDAFMDKFGYMPSGSEYQEVSPQYLERISSVRSPEGIVAVFPLPEKQNRPDGPVFWLEGLQDPGNIGAIMRVADWFGIPSIILSQDCADPWQPKVVRASMGSLFKLHIEVVPDFHAALAQVTDTVVLADMEGTPLQDYTFPENWNLVFGKEGSGLSDEVRALDQTQKIAIPGDGKAESLNVGIAAGIIAWQYFQHKK
jgi:RNA methyltransferase, TrmH family